MYRGDIRLGDTLDFKFTSRTFSTGAPGTLSSSPVVSAYPNNSTTQLTAGITLTVDFDSVTGLNHVRVVASGGNGYATATNYDLVITTGTVGGVSVVGEVIGSFSIEARSALMPTSATRTLDVSSSGNAGIDLDNIQLTNGAPILGLVASGTLSGTHTTTTADLGTNAPSLTMAGKWLRIPTRDVSSYISAYNTGTGVATFNPATAATLADDDQWFVADAPNLPTDTALMQTVKVSVGTGTGQINSSGGKVPATIAAGDLAANSLTASALASDAVAEIQSGLASQSSVDDLPTNAELATALGTADDAMLSAIAAVSSKVDTVDDLLDTELPALTTAVADLPTNAELATALGTADDAVLAQVALVKAVTDKIDDTLEDDGGTYRFTTNALEQAPTGGSAPSAAAIADAVWDEAIAGHAVSGSTGEALAAAGGAGDPWITTLPGSYSSGQAGFILGTNLNGTVSSRASQTSVDDLPTNAELTTALGTADDAVLTRLGTPAGVSIAADIAAVQADTDNIQTRIPAALVSGRMDASVGAMAANVMTAAAAASDLTTELQSGLATAAALATLQTSVDDVPTNAELTTALGTADDAVLARLGTPAGASVSADIAAAKAQLVAIEADTQDLQARTPAALDNGYMIASVKRVATTTLVPAGSGGQGIGG